MMETRAQVQMAWIFFSFKNDGPFLKKTLLNLSKKEVTASFLTMIPNNLNPQEMKGYKLINLIVFLYKILSKLLANRFRKVLKKSSVTVSSNICVRKKHVRWGASVGWDNGLSKEEEDECLILKVDFEQAYDCINWNYLKFLLRRIGYGENWMLSMEACIFNNSMSVLVNGSPTSDFKVERGLM